MSSVAKRGYPNFENPVKIIATQHLEKVQIPKVTASCLKGLLEPGLPLKLVEGRIQ